MYPESHYPPLSPDFEEGARSHAHNLVYMYTQSPNQDFETRFVRCRPPYFYQRVCEIASHLLGKEVSLKIQTRDGFEGEYYDIV